jgi:protein-S-isoprenylcysteine O-methyltransferase Ste14
MMANILKQIFSFILPITVLVIVPVWIEKDWTVSINFFLFAGSTLGLIGLIIMIICISSFIRIGRGTLAPWSPTKKLVVSGLYRYVRNPMILGVWIVLLGEALALKSQNILIWAVSFFIINTIYFIVYEEPDLEDRFGNEYRDYKKHVFRWLPRLRPYEQYQNERR